MSVSFNPSGFTSATRPQPVFAAQRQAVRPQFAGDDTPSSAPQKPAKKPFGSGLSWLFWPALAAVIIVPWRASEIIKDNNETKAKQAAIAECSDTARANADAIAAGKLEVTCDDGKIDVHAPKK